MSSDKGTVTGAEGEAPVAPTVSPNVVEYLRTVEEDRRRVFTAIRLCAPFLRQVERDLGLTITWQVTTVTPADVVARTPLDVLVDATATEVEHEQAARALLTERWSEPMRPDVERKRLDRIRQGAAELCRPRRRVCLDGVEYLRGVDVRQKCARILAPPLRLRWFWGWVDAARFGKRAPQRPVAAHPKTGRRARTPTPLRRGGAHSTTRRRHESR